MEEEESVIIDAQNVSNFQVSTTYNRLPTSDQSESATSEFAASGILQGATTATALATIVAIATTSIRNATAASVAHVANSQTSFSNDINNDSDYIYDPLDNYKRVYQNFTVNTPIERSANIAANTVASASDLIMATSTNVFWSNVGGNGGSRSENVSIMMDTATATSTVSNIINDQNNYWALFALVLVVGTAAGNILVCLAIAWERRLQNVTNYFLMSLAITDLMVAILVMPLGILTLVKGFFPLESVHCLAWICLDVLFCTASIMHLCTISIDRYLSLRYPMRFGRNKTRKRVTVKIIFVWLLSIAMSLPLSLMYSKDHASVLVNGTCQIPDPVYKLVGSIVCFYIPLGVMLITYCLTVRLLARQQQSLCGGGGSIGGGTGAAGSTGNQANGWASGWLGQQPALERRCTWRRLLKTSLPLTPSHAHSAASTDTELSTLDTHELWLPDSSIPESNPSTMTALHQFGAEMLKLSRGLDAVSSIVVVPMAAATANATPTPSCSSGGTDSSSANSELTMQQIPLLRIEPLPPKLSRERNRPISSSRRHKNKRRASHSTWSTVLNRSDSQQSETNGFRKRFNSLPRIEQDDDNGFDESESIVDDEVETSLSRRTSHCGSDRAPDEEDIEDDGKVEKICGDKDSKNRRNSNEKSKSQLCVHEQQKQHQHEQIGTKTDEIVLPPPCTCPYFGLTKSNALRPAAEVKIVSINGREEYSPLIPSTDRITVTIVPPPPTTLVTATSLKTCVKGSSTPSLHLLPTPNLPLHKHSTLSGRNSTTPTPATSPTPTPIRKLSYSTTGPHVKSNSVVTWDTGRNQKSRRDSSFGGHQATTTLLLTPKKVPTLTSPLRRSATLRNHNNIINGLSSGGGLSAGMSSTRSIDNSVTSILSANSKSGTNKSAPCLFSRCGTVRSHHSRNSSVISRNSSRHGRIIRLEQKATKVLGVVFFTFVILWAPFFVLNLLPTVCGECEQQISHWVFDVVTWLGYASSMVNPIFYTIFNKVFRQAFKKVLMCQYGETKWRPQR